MGRLAAALQTMGVRMPKTIRLILIFAVAVVVLTAGCGSTPDQPAAASSAPQAAATMPPAAQDGAQPSAASSAALRRTVRSDIDRIMADIKAAEARGDVIDGVPVGDSSNPYDYVGVSPVFRELVALGRPALPAIVAEIEASGQNGLREYLLAAAGAQIDGEVPGSGAQSWHDGKEWARQHREDQ